MRYTLLLVLLVFNLVGLVASIATVATLTLSLACFQLQKKNKTTIETHYS